MTPRFSRASTARHARPSCICVVTWNAVPRAAEHFIPVRCTGAQPVKRSLLRTILCPSDRRALSLSRHHHAL